MEQYKKQAEQVYLKITSWANYTQMNDIPRQTFIDEIATAIKTAAESQEPVSAPSGPWHIRTEESKGHPESGDMSVDVKSFITDGNIELSTSDDGDLQSIVDALNASECRFNSHHADQLRCHILEYEKEQLQAELAELKARQIAGVQWVKASERLPDVYDAESVFYKLDDKKVDGYIIFEDKCEPIFEYRHNGYKTISDLSRVKWLDESSSSLSTATEQVTIDQLRDELDDKRVLMLTNMQEPMWHLVRKHSAEHLLDKFDIYPKGTPPSTKEQETAIAILRELVELKELKEKVGITPHYERRKPQVWAAARLFLQSQTKQQ